MEFKDQIKKMRIKHGLTQSGLSVLVGKTESAIRMWETGRAYPDCRTLLKLAAHFNCTTDYLLGLDEHPTRALTDICEYTGLSSNEIETLRCFKELKNTQQISMGNYDEICASLDNDTTLTDDERLEKKKEVLDLIQSHWEETNPGIICADIALNGIKMLLTTKEGSEALQYIGKLFEWRMESNLKEKKTLAFANIIDLLSRMRYEDEKEAGQAG